jgi:hypothetical protein
MAERFSELPDSAFIFRLVNPNSHFLPAGIELPLPGWFEPSSGDVEEAAGRGRRPGLSVWNKHQAEVEQVKQLLARPDAMAFGLIVHDCKQIGQRHERELTVVADPADQHAPAPGWDAHSLIEGLKRPAEVTKQAHRDLLTDLSRACQGVG